MTETDTAVVAAEKTETPWPGNAIEYLCKTWPRMNTEGGRFHRWAHVVERAGNMATVVHVVERLLAGPCDAISPTPKVFAAELAKMREHEAKHAPEPTRLPQAELQAMDPREQVGQIVAAWANRHLPAYRRQYGDGYAAAVPSLIARLDGELYGVGAAPNQIEWGVKTLFGADAWDDFNADRARRLDEFLAARRDMD
ncbi:MAG: hypothetical protein KDK91_34430 [Gammaproteobacteria bacterium]|nr:hypothetical protein [Gammaproteobacteria bacterium]